MMCTASPAWQWLFLAGGLPRAALGLVVLLRLDDDITHANWLSCDKRRIISAQLNRQREEIGEHSPWRALLMPGRLRQNDLEPFCIINRCFSSSGGAWRKPSVAKDETSTAQWASWFETALTRLLTMRS
jgi:hypothetical protein